MNFLYPASTAASKDFRSRTASRSTSFFAWVSFSSSHSKTCHGFLWSGSCVPEDPKCTEDPSCILPDFYPMNDLLRAPEYLHFRSVFHSSSETSLHGSSMLCRKVVPLPSTRIENGGEGLLSHICSRPDFRSFPYYNSLSLRALMLC